MVILPKLVFPYWRAVTSVMDLVRKKVRRHLLVLTVMAQAKSESRKVSFHYSRLAHVVVVRVVLLPIHVDPVVVLAGLSGAKSSQLKFLRALILAIESVYLAKVRPARTMARLEIYTYR